MMITTYKCDRCGREIPSEMVLRATIDRPVLVARDCKIIKGGMDMDLCIDCYSVVTKTPIDVFAKYFT